MRILTIKRRTIIIFLCVLVCLVMIGVYFGLKTTSAQPNIKPTIVIDAGHGGVDVKLGQYIKQKRHIG